MNTSSAASDIMRVLRLRLKDKHACVLRAKAFWVNQCWNYCNETSYKVWQRERRFLSGYDLDKMTTGASKEGVPLHSQTIQAIGQEYARRRKQFNKAKLRWRKSSGARRSLGWIPFKASALRYRNGQLWMSGIDQALGLWDSYGLSKYQLGAGSFSEDARGRWYININVKVAREPRSAATNAVGIDLGLKHFATLSNGEKIEALKHYLHHEAKLAMAHRAGKKRLVKTIHARIANQRKHQHHVRSTELVQRFGAIFVGNVNASALAKTRMAKSVLDAGWSQFRAMLRYKSDSAGVWFDKVDEAFSTQDCSVCEARSGPKGLKDLEIRVWTCNRCGAIHDRDVNAAKNILRRGHATLAVGIPLLTAHAAALR
ncbi:RNA-guided endonuclease InsQ/TnpB family protein [Pseudoduganella dura]|nr:transposase [Pseudoduganella dura]